ncbi:MAG: DinB family protein [Anaerolineales bacterium]
MLNAVQRATGRELRKGPRGGGRDIDKILDHVLEADQGYLARLAWKHKSKGGKNSVEELSQTREAILNALEVALKGDLPEHGPRGGIIWPARYFIRRVAWHVLDHAWEIDDRIV